MWMVIMQHILIAFGVEIIPKEIKKVIDNKNTIINTFWIKEYISIMCGNFCIQFIGFMVNGKSIFGYTNLFSPNEYEKDDKVILKFFNN